MYGHEVTALGRSEILSGELVGVSQNDPDQGETSYERLQKHMYGMGVLYFGSVVVNPLPRVNGQTANPIGDRKLEWLLELAQTCELGINSS